MGENEDDDEDASRVDGSSAEGLTDSASESGSASASSVSTRYRRPQHRPGLQASDSRSSGYRHEHDNAMQHHHDRHGSVEAGSHDLESVEGHLLWHNRSPQEPEADFEEVVQDGVYREQLREHSHGSSYYSTFQGMDRYGYESRSAATVSAVSAAGNTRDSGANGDGVGDGARSVSQRKSGAGKYTDFLGEAAYAETEPSRNKPLRSGTQRELSMMSSSTAGAGWGSGAVKQGPRGAFLLVSGTATRPGPGPGPGPGANLRGNLRANLRANLRGNSAPGLVGQ